MTAELINFLRDRYGGERADALKRTGVFPSPVVHGNGHVSLHVYPGGTAVNLRGPGPDGYDDLAALKTWASAERGWTQGRVLAEVEAKRRLIELHEPVILRGGGGAEYFNTARVCRSCEPNRQFIERAYPCATLRLLALPYADHPDYQEEWRP